MNTNISNSTNSPVGLAAGELNEHEYFKLLE